MSRRKAGYEDKRRDLAHKVYRCVMEGQGTSLNALAAYAGVSRPTLRHYFDDREGAIQAGLVEAARVGGRFMDGLAGLPTDDGARTAVEQALTLIVYAWRTVGIGVLHEVGMRIGLEHRATGQTYVDHILEPMLAGLEGLVAHLVEEGRVRPCTPRLAVLQLTSPVFVALLHQDGLGGREVRPLDVDRVVEETVDVWMAAYGVTAESSVGVGEPEDGT